MRRSIAAILAVINALNGLVMLIAGPFWWNAVPGVTETGPYNPHFVQDVGAAFLAAGLALGARAWRAKYWPAAVAGAAFLVVHALLHLVMIVAGHDHHAAANLALVVLPAALALYFSVPKPRRPPCVAGSRAACFAR
jgi:peptidoglycan/LPS O-acetylase OafA/YrhL